MENTAFSGPADFQESRIGAMQIKETSINGVISFDGSHVGRLQDLDFQTPHPHGQESLLSLGGMTYELLGHKQRLFHSLEQAEFSRLDYAVLEGYLKAHGDSDLADDVFVHMKRRERRDSQWWKRPWGYLLDALVRYGRAPERAFYLAFVIILFGTFLFWKRSDVCAQRAEDDSRVYNPFWYSFDLLVPAIDLQAASVWMPKAELSISTKLRWRPSDPRLGLDSDRRGRPDGLYQVTDDTTYSGNRRPRDFAGHKLEPCAAS
jgi:hypothetical protein